MRRGGIGEHRPVPACTSTIVIRAVAFFLLPGFHVLDLGILSVFELANRQPGGPFYALTMMSEEGGAVAGAAGASVETRRWPDGGARVDTLVVLGCGAGASPAAHTSVVLRRASAGVRRIAIVCDAADALAATGLLDERRVAVRQTQAPALRARHPRVKVESDRVYMRDGSHWSSAGMTASIDMALAMVEEDLGLEIAMAVARRLVMVQWRREGQAQSSALLHMRPRSSPIQQVLGYVSRNLRRQLSLDELAGQANMSRRHFTRVFRAETGQSPGRAIEALRAEAALALLRNSRLSFEAIAREAGFASAEGMRQALLRVYGETPQEIRRGTRAA